MFAVLTYRRDWDEDDFFATGAQEIDEVMDYTAHLGLRPAADAALDFGCGLGRLTRALGQRFNTVVGVDIAEPMVARARTLNRGFPNCTFVHNVRPDLSVLDSESFDFVYSNITLQHMPWSLAQGYLAEFLRVLRPGGVLVFQLPTKVRAQPSGSRTRELVTRVRGFVGVVLRLGRRHMEMHCTPADVVRQAVADAGGQVVDAKPDDRVGRRWDSLRYTVIRANAS
jgi:SAM-dependent methyltransferase